VGTVPTVSTVIEVEHLHKRYRDTVAVSDVSLSVRRGEIFGLLGPNGAGKTTTVECLQGLRPCDGGRVSVLGLDPGRDPDRLRRRIGSQLQSAALPDRLRVGESVRLFARGRREPVDVDAVLDLWGLEPLRRRAFGALSGGQQQRLFLALALLGEPEVVFLDELTTGLDPTARRSTWDLVRRVRDRGATVVLVTHFMEEAQALCDRVAVVDDGRVVAQDTPQALTASRGGPITVTFTVPGHGPRGSEGHGPGGGPDREPDRLPRDLLGLKDLPGVESVTVDGARVAVRGTGAVAVHVAAELLHRDLAPADLRTHHPTLEDVFLALTGHGLGEEAR